MLCIPWVWPAVSDLEISACSPGQALPACGQHLRDLSLVYMRLDWGEDGGQSGQ